MRRIRTGVVGYGLAGRVFHAPFVHAVPELELTAIVQRTGDTAKQAYPEAAQMRSLDELLASDVELAVIGTPSHTHFALSKQALEAGKHVVCDKPVTTTSAQAEELEALAKSKGLLFFPFQNRRWDGDFKTLQKLLAGNAVGRAVTLDSRFDRYRPVPKSGAWREDEEAGGLLFDIGPHLIDQALVLFGRPSRVQANLRRDRDTGGNVPDAFDLNLFFTGPDDRDILVRLGTTVLAIDPAPRYRLHGTRGSFVKYGLDPQEPALVAGGSVPPAGSPEVWLQEQESMWGTLSVVRDPAKPTDVECTQVKTEIGDYRAYYSNVAASILGTAEPAITARAAVHVARIIELAQQSSDTGATVAVAAAGW